MDIKIGTGNNSLIINKTGNGIAFDAVNKHNSVCSDLSPEQAIHIVNQLFTCLGIKSKVIIRNRYEIETI